MTTTQQNCCWHALTLHSFSYLTCTNCDSNIQCSFSYTRKHRNKHLETNKSCTMREVPKKFKDLRKVGVRNIVQCSAVQQTCNLLRVFFFHRHSLLPYYRHVCRSVWPAREAKPRFGAVLECSAHQHETCLFERRLPLIPIIGSWLHQGVHKEDH